MMLSRLNTLLKFLFWSFVLWIAVRLFLFQGFKVPTASMSNTLREGDYVVVNKVACGARLPITPLSIHLGGRHYFLDVLQLPYLRMPGYATVGRNDIVVFNLPTESLLPVDERRAYIKRCIGLPGECLRIDAGGVYINGSSEPLAAPGQALGRYQVWTKGSPYPRELFLSAAEAKQAAASDTVKQITTQAVEGYAPSYFPNTPQIKWNPDHMGPLWIPRKGAKLRLSMLTFPIYQRAIELYEGNAVSFKNDSIFINGKAESYYTFRMDYYVVMGDNRANSVDSRFWGFVPEDHLIGVAFSRPF